MDNNTSTSQQIHQNQPNQNQTNEALNLLFDWYNQNQDCQVKDLPKFHKEYFEEHPDQICNEELISFLEGLYGDVKYRPFQEHYLEPGCFSPHLIVQRWGAYLLSQKEEFTNFIRYSKPGDIFKKLEPKPYGTGMVQENGQIIEKQTLGYQCIRNFENVQISLQPNKTYVQIGFVDLSSLLWLQTETDLTLDGDGQSTFYFVDLNEICVARSIIIHKMLLEGMSVRSIFEVWHSSCLSQQSVQDLQMAIDMLLLEDQQEGKVRALLKHWLKVLSNIQNLSVQKAIDSWYETVDPSDFFAIAALTDRKSRVSYSRYQLTGTFGKTMDYIMGNPTYFSLPPSYKEYTHRHDNLFSSIPISKIIEQYTSLDEIKQFVQGTQDQHRSSKSSHDIIQHILEMIFNNLHSLSQRLQ